DELKGEKIDIVEYSEDPVVYVSNALSPSKVRDVLVDEEENATTVIVPDYQLSLAIGKRGQNARLAAKLTGLKIDIKSESEAREEALSRENSEHERDGEQLFTGDSEMETYEDDLLSEEEKSEKPEDDDDLFA